jgi:hypothetical protein
LGGHGVLLERADHLEPCAVADVREPGVTVPAEVALEDASIGCAVEEGAPVLELPDALGRFLRVDLCHPPVVEELPAPHGVAEVHLPVVLGIHVAQGRSDAALRHHRVGFAEERLADERCSYTRRRRLDRGSEPRAAGPDDYDVVGMRLVVGH